MSRIRKMATAGATFSVALGIGFVMQNGDALAGRFGALPPGVEPGPMARTSAPRTIVTVADAPVMPVAQVVQVDTYPAFSLSMDGLPDLSALPQMTASLAVQIGQALTPSPQDQPQVSADISLANTPVTEPTESHVLLAALELSPPAPAEPPVVAVAPPDCTATLQAQVAPLGMAVLTLAAPCAPGQAIMIHHDGLMFTALTDQTGAVQVTVPALSVNAVFVVDLGQGQGAVATATLPDVAGLDRAVVQGRAGMGLALHAFVDGAAFGAPGHVWQNQPGAPGDASGFLTSLGTAEVEGAFVAQVYTGPQVTTAHVALMTEAAVTDGNCGQGLAAQTLQLSPGGPVFVRDLSMAMPDCQAIGEFVALPEALLDLRLAAN